MTYDPVDTSQAEDEDTEREILILFFGLIAVLLIALFLVARGGEDALAAEVQIEKLWDEQEREAAADSEGYVPAPPPMAPPTEEE